MARIWNPGAKRETVGDFLEAWCVQRKGLWSQTEDLFGAYEIFCRIHRQKDLTYGEFVDEMETRRFSVETRHGASGFDAVGLAVAEDGRVTRKYGLRVQRW